MNIALVALCCCTLQDPAARREAELGAETRAATPAEAKEYSLPGGVRTQGQFVERVEAGGPAARAGIAPGDVLLELASVKLYSRDALEDVLRVTPAGAETTVRVRRAKTFQDENLLVRMGGRASTAQGIDWQFASLEQLEAALARSKKEGKKVLVGISGAET